MLSRLSPAQRPHRITLQNPGPPVPDGEGGFEPSWLAVTPPQLWASIEPASRGSLEAVTAGTVIATATHLIVAPFHPQVTPASRVQFYDTLRQRDRIFTVSSLCDTQERDLEMTLICAEVID
jgi:head-tail adaptor